VTSYRSEIGGGETALLRWFWGGRTARRSFSGPLLSLLSLTPKGVESGSQRPGRAAAQGAGRGRIPGRKQQGTDVKRDGAQVNPAAFPSACGVPRAFCLPHVQSAECFYSHSQLFSPLHRLHLVHTCIVLCQLQL